MKVVLEGVEVAQMEKLAISMIIQGIYSAITNKSMVILHRDSQILQSHHVKRYQFLSASQQGLNLMLCHLHLDNTRFWGLNLSCVQSTNSQCLWCPRKMCYPDNNMLCLGNLLQREGPYM